MKVKLVKYLEKYKLEVTFTNGTIKIADFKKFLVTAKNPMITKNLDISRFKKVVIDNGFLSWNDGEMEISANSLMQDF